MSEDENSKRHAFVTKVDEFAATLTSAERAMLAELIAGDGHEPEVSGFTARWPGLRVIAPAFVGADIDATPTADFQSEAGGSPNVLFADRTGFASSASGSPNV